MQHIESRVFGPPGTGKTTFLTRQIGLAIDKHGADKVMVASFTKTAAQELVSRNKDSDVNIGTLHAHCFRTLGVKEIAENHIDEFNKAFPQFRLSDESGKCSIEDTAADVGPSGKTPGDDMFHKVNVLRAKMVPQELWPHSAVQFTAAWQIFKKSSHYVDFTDMIDIAYQYIGIAPGDPTVGFFDEAQDFTPLQLALIRKWAKSMDNIVICGDDDQLLYAWLGASTDVFLQGTPDVKKVLSQSYRIPAAVHKYAEKWISQINTREKKEYKPRDFEGSIRGFSSGNFKESKGMVVDCEKYLAQGKTIMFLSSCSYMLSSVIRELRKAGIPFHNEYREKQGAWNPIKTRSQEGQVSTVDRLLAYLAGCPEVSKTGSIWTAQDMSRWIPIVKSKGNFKKGMKKQMEESKLGTFFDVDIQELMQIFDEGSSFWEAYNNFNLDTAARWLKDNAVGTKLPALEFPLNIIKRTKDLNCFTKPPQVTVGTIHSVKGGEADVVYLMPDLSLSGMQEYTKGSDAKDSITRMFYVGMTRARETLILCNAATHYAVNWRI